MIISFSVFKEKILDGTKTQTIRRYSEFQYKRFCNAKKYQLYWGNPRNGGELIKEVEPSQKPFLIKFSSLLRDAPDMKGLEPETDIYSITYFKGGLLTKDVHQRDGFKTMMDMVDWFYKKYGEDMFNQKFMVLRWKP
jgi:hypothetical protein